jgi:GNAT superfamily N-acetyltransferase
VPETAPEPTRPAVPTIRRARTDDAVELADLFWRVREQSVPAIPMIAHPRETVLPFVRDVLLQDFEVHVVVQDGQLTGFLALMAPDHLGHLYLDANHTGQGLGSRLVDLAKARFPDGLRLWAFQDNRDALRFYRRHGFVEVEWTDGDNEEGAPDVLMVWSPASEGHPWTTVGQATGADGRAVTVVEDLTSVDGPMAFVDADGAWTVLERRLEPTADDSPAHFGGHSVDKVLGSSVDLLGRELLAGDDDPDPARVGAMLPPVEGMPTWSFVGSPFTADTLAVDSDGRTPTVDAAQVLPQIRAARADRRVLAGLVGGWLPALRFVYPDGPDRPDAWCELVVFAPVRSRSHPAVQQVWHRITRVEAGAVVSTTCLDTYPAVHPRGPAAPEDLHTALVAFHDDWHDLTATATKVDLPDARLADLARHGLARAMLTRTGGLPRYGVVDRDYGGAEHDGFQDTFTVELAAATDWGLHDHAVTVLDTYLEHFVRDDGSLEYRGPATGQYGRMLTTIAHLHRCRGDTTAVLRHRPRIDAVADLLLDRRRKSLLLDPDDPGRGLLAGWCEADSALETDPDRYLVPYLSSSAEAVRGLTDLAGVWAAIGTELDDAELGDRAAHLAGEAKGLREDLERAIVRDLRLDLDPPWLPVVAGATTPWHEAVAADPDDPQFRAYRANAELLHSGCLTTGQVDTVLRYREEHGDIVLGVPCAYGLSRDPGLVGNKELAGFLAHGHFHGLLQHDQVREFLLGLWALAQHHHTRGSWTAPETRRVRPGSPAAPYCVPAQLAVPALVRWMLVFEQPVADELWLARAVPRAWLAHGQRLSVESAPTRWGPVGYAVRSHLDEGRLEATVTLPASAPQETWLRLRLPLGHRIATAALDGQPVGVDRAREAVRLTGAGREIGLLVLTEQADPAAQT